MRGVVAVNRGTQTALYPAGVKVVAQKVGQAFDARMLVGPVIDG